MAIADINAGRTSYYRWRSRSASEAFSVSTSRSSASTRVARLTESSPSCVSCCEFLVCALGVLALKRLIASIASVTDTLNGAFERRIPTLGVLPSSCIFWQIMINWLMVLFIIYLLLPLCLCRLSMCRPQCVALTALPSLYYPQCAAFNVLVVKAFEFKMNVKHLTTYQPSGSLPKVPYDISN